jgi:DNA-directed RNA polymerase specialized sigma24 family protein
MDRPDTFNGDCETIVKTALARSIVKTVSFFDQEDLFQEGMLVAWKKWLNWDQKKYPNVSFSTHLYYAVCNRMLDLLRIYGPRLRNSGRIRNDVLEEMAYLKRGSPIVGKELEIHDEVERALRVARRMDKRVSRRWGQTYIRKEKLLRLILDGMKVGAAIKQLGSIESRGSQIMKELCMALGHKKLSA